MPEILKGKSPFYPGQPVPVELFVGRREQIDRIVKRGIGQTAAGKPGAFFIQGDYGIGKSSMAGFVQRYAEEKFGLHSIYVPLGGAESLEDMAEAVVQATLRSGAFNPTRSEKVRKWLAKYMGKQELFGIISIDVSELRKDAPKFASPFGMLEFLGEARRRLDDTGVKGIFLVLDEINGISKKPHFAHFLKGLVDQNASLKNPLPLLLMLCGVEDIRRELIRHHQPVERIFDVVDIESMTNDEVVEFFQRSFSSVEMTVDQTAMAMLTHYSAGLPKIMHLIGDAAFWIDKDGKIDDDDAVQAVIAAADDVGKKFVDQQIYKALRSEAYHSILKKIGQSFDISNRFLKSEISKGLTGDEQKKLGNFLQRMKRLKVIRSGDVQGEYVFNVPMVQVYLFLQSSRNKRK